MPLSTSLISYWRLEEASGQRNDSHGTNHLTDTNTVLSAAGKVGTAADFERSNSESLNLTSNSTVQTGDIDFTFTAWVFVEGQATDMGIVAKRGGATEEYSLDYELASDRFRFLIFSSATPYIAVANNLGAVADATWYFLVGWHDATANTVNIQVNNGTVDSTSTTGAAPNSSTGTFYLGRRATASTFYDGLMDEVSFWKRLLTAEERTTLYNGGSGQSYAFVTGKSPPILPRPFRMWFKRR